MTKPGLIEQREKFVASQHSIAGKMPGAESQCGRYGPIPHVIGIRCQAEKAATELEHPVDTGQRGPLVEHMLEGANTNRQIDRPVGDSVQLLGVADLKRKFGFPG